MSLRVAINGFGRIGRAAFKIILAEHKDLEVVAINDLTDKETLAHLLKYDSVYGKLNFDIKTNTKGLVIKQKTYPVYSEKDHGLLPWKDLKVDIVLECTGRFNDKESAALHLNSGARRVILSAPAKKGGVKTLVLGVNQASLKKTDLIVSNASCTTNCLAPIVNSLKQSFGLKQALMTTIHAYTTDQNLLDATHKDLRRARAAAINIVPTTTGAALATSDIIPSLKGKFDGLAMRVPVPVASLVDIVCILEKKTSLEQIAQEFKRLAKGKLKGILELSQEELVSSDIVANTHSAVVDIKASKLIGGNFLKIIAWYDNEWAYAKRLVELASMFKKFLK